MEDEKIKENKIEENKIDENKNKEAWKIISNILFGLFMTMMIIAIIITAQSKFTGREPKLLGYRVYVVDSGSMSPTIKTDSMIIVKESKTNEINIADIITYYGHNKESRVTHRVIDIENKGEFFITKGDANEVPDPMPLEGEKIIGKVILVIPIIGKMFRFLNTQLGMGMLITLIILWIIIPVMSSRIRKSKKYVL